MLATSTPVFGGRPPRRRDHYHLSVREAVELALAPAPAGVAG
jgi:hypothetical protein